MTNSKHHEKAGGGERVATSKRLKDIEIDSLKQKLYISRKELDTYISFTKRSEREKRRWREEKEELDKKVHYHERKLKLFEKENKTLRSERANMLNQIYDLMGKSRNDSVSSKQSTDQKVNVEITDQPGEVIKEPDVKRSRKRLINEADGFAHERKRLVKGRQRLDEEVRKVQMRCVSLLAENQRKGNTIDELKVEKEELKQKITLLVKDADERRKNAVASPHNDTTCNRQPDVNLQVGHNEQDCPQSHDGVRNIESGQFGRENENGLSVSDKSGNHCLNYGVNHTEEERRNIQHELDIVLDRLTQLQNETIEMQSDQKAFRTFLERMSMELQEKLGEDHVSKDKEAESLQKQAEIILKQVMSHITPPSKCSDDLEALREENAELEQELEDMKYVLSQRMEVQSLKSSSNFSSRCDCEKEREQMKKEKEGWKERIDGLEDEVNRLHQDKQQLLMSFLSLQALQSQPKDCTTSTGDDEDSSEEERSDPSKLEDIYLEEDDTFHTLPHHMNTLHENETHDDVSTFHSTETEIEKQLQQTLITNEELENERDELLVNLADQISMVKRLRTELEDWKRLSSSVPRGLDACTQTGSCDERKRGGSAELEDWKRLSSSVSRGLDACTQTTGSCDERKRGGSETCPNSTNTSTTMKVHGYVTEDHKVVTKSISQTTVVNKASMLRNYDQRSPEPDASHKVNDENTLQNKKDRLLAESRILFFVFFLFFCFCYYINI